MIHLLMSRNSYQNFPILEANTGYCIDNKFLFMSCTPAISHRLSACLPDRIAYTFGNDT